MMLHDRIKAARRAGVPILQIITRDIPAIVRELRSGWNGNVPPILTWDAARGFSALNEPGLVALRDDLGINQPGPIPLVDALVAALNLPKRSILMVQSADRWLPQSGEAIAAVLNIRDDFKSDQRTLILIVSDPSLPPELAADVLPLDDPLPDETELGAILDRQLAAYGEAYEPAPCDSETRAAAIAAVLGLPRFGAEQAIALSLVEHNAIVPDDLSERQRVAVRQIPGLTMDRGGPTLDQIGGLSAIRTYFDRIMRGPYSPAVIVRIEELEKAIAGFGSDTSGTTDSMVGVMLSAMEDNGWTGILTVGPAGAGKSLIGKAVGRSYGRKSLCLDLGSTKGSLVGQSEQRIRMAIATIHAIGRGRVFFLASVNKLDRIPAPLQRRFRGGIYYFDLPDEAERGAIWPIQLAAHGLPADSMRPDDSGWTGADIRNCCELARNMAISLTEASAYITPVSKIDPEGIRTLQHSAAGRWLSASYPGTYEIQRAEKIARQYGRE